MEHVLRILDFNVYNEKKEPSSSDDEKNAYKDNSQFIIQMFGINENKETYSINVEGFQPFFYILVNDSWNITTKNAFLEHIKEKIGKYYEKSITNCIIVKRKKLYGFDAGKEHKFIKLEFLNMNAFNKTKNLWYNDYKDGHSLLKDGYLFQHNNLKTFTKIYESNIPPLLRFFHIKDISPSGWIGLPKKKTININEDFKKTSCTYEYQINYKDIISLNQKETRVPFKICSFDIEASSSHGDFPVPIKSYKKLATNIIEYFENLNFEITKNTCKLILKNIILSAFGYEKLDTIDLVYPKKNPKSREELETKIDSWLQACVRSKTANIDILTTLEKLF